MTKKPTAYSQQPKAGYRIEKRFKGPKVQGFKEIEPTVDTRQPTADRKDACMEF